MEQPDLQDAVREVCINNSFHPRNPILKRLSIPTVYSWSKNTFSRGTFKKSASLIHLETWNPSSMQHWLWFLSDRARFCFYMIHRIIEQEEVCVRWKNYGGPFKYTVCLYYENCQCTIVYFLYYKNGSINIFSVALYMRHPEKKVTYRACIIGLIWKRIERTKEKAYLVLKVNAIPYITLKQPLYPKNK